MSHFILILSVIILLFFFKDVLPKKQTTNRAGSKIVGGFPTSIMRYPYQAHVSVRKDNTTYLCGGSIISNRYILTAAHCLYGSPSSVRVRVGSTFAHSGGREYNTTKFGVHPKFTLEITDYDVGYVDIGKKIAINGFTTKIIKLVGANTKIENGTEIVVTGWGQIAEDGPLSETLMALKVSTVSSEYCRQQFPEDGPIQITPRVFCAGGQAGKSHCHGDSGGPAVSTKSGLQLGIVSFGRGCARAGLPAGYTNISAVRDWIKTNTGV